MTRKAAGTQAWLGSGQLAGGRFWVWWVHALRSCLPATWQAQLAARAQRLLLIPHGSDVTVALEKGGHRQIVASGPLAGGLPAAATQWAELPRHWLLPAGSALRRRLPVPAAAGPRLREVMRFEIDRQTPFTAEQVVFDARVLGHHADGQLDVELVTVPRQRVDVLERAPWSGTLAGLDVEDDTGVPSGLNLLPETQRHARTDPARRWNLLLTVSAGLVLVAAGAQLLDNRRAALEVLRAQVERDAGAARRVAVQRQQLQDLVDGVAFVDGKRRERDTMLGLWNELSARLPDDTWLERLSVEAGELQVIGVSASAPSLVGLLEGAPGWESPSLTSVLQTDEGNGRGRFTLGARLKSPRQPAGEQGDDASSNAP